MLLAEAQDTSEHSLKRVLGPVNLVTLGVGMIIGAGIFVLTGRPPPNSPDPPSCCPLSWLESVAPSPDSAMPNSLLSFPSLDRPKSRDATELRLYSLGYDPRS